MKVLFSVLCLACFSSQAAEPFTLYFTRHAEKIETTDADPGLTPAGFDRAQKLAEFLASKKIEVIYSTDYQRTQQTALPAAQQLKLAVIQYDPNKLPGLADIIITRQQNALIVGHSNTTPTMVLLTGGEAEPIEDSEYGKLFAVTVDGKSRSTLVHFIEP